MVLGCVVVVGFLFTSSSLSPSTSATNLRADDINSFNNFHGAASNNGNEKVVYVDRVVEKVVYAESGGGTVKRSDVLLQRLIRCGIKRSRQKASGQHDETLCTQPVLKNGRPVEHIGVFGTDCEPWIVRDAVYGLDCLLEESDELNGLEWGSGSSSMWLVTRLRSLVSIDNSQEWLNHVQDFFATPNSVGYNLVNLSNEDRSLLHWVGSDKRWVGILAEGTSYCKDEFYRSSEPAKLCYVDYTNLGRGVQPLGMGYTQVYYKDGTATETAVDNQPKHVFDYVAVDGRARVPCMRIALQMIKEDGGILLLDNSERPNYKAAIDMVPPHWKRVDYYGVRGEYRTTIWITIKQ